MATVEHPNNVQDKKRAKRKSSPQKNFPSNTIEEARKVAELIKSNNGGNPWSTDQLAKALGYSKSTHDFFYIVAASRDYGFTLGSSSTVNIELTDLGKDLVYATSSEVSAQSVSKAFNNIEKFKSVYEYYGGSEPENEEFFKNALLTKFSILDGFHDCFLRIYRANVNYVKQFQSSSFDKKKAASTLASTSPGTSPTRKPEPGGHEESDSQKSLFVIMPFTEKSGKYDFGFFNEVFCNLVVPAAKMANMKALTAKKEGSDVIHATIGKQIRKADIILADLTEHNPNVLFELGLAIMMRKQIVLIRAKGTLAIFDVDNVMRVWDYDSRLWPSLIEKDIPELAKNLSTLAGPTDKTYYDIFLGD